MAQVARYGQHAMDRVSIWKQWLGIAVGVLLSSAYVVFLAWFIGWSQLRRLRPHPERHGPAEGGRVRFSASEMAAVGRAAADVVSLKLVKHGGLLNTRKVAAVAEAASIGLYRGCHLESSIGAAAHLHVTPRPGPAGKRI